MEISPERKDLIKSFLSLLISEDEVEQFTNLGDMITLIKQGKLCWQAPVSIGVHAAILHIVKTDAEDVLADADDALLQNLIGHALEPLEALLESLVPKSAEKSLEDERARMLFHTRLGLGFLLWEKGDEERSKAILHEMAATKLPIRGAEVRSEPGTLSYSRDLGNGKWLAALLMCEVYKEEEEYGEALYLVTEAAACQPRLSVLREEVPALLDSWVEKCKKEDATQEYDFPILEWLDVFAEAAEILSVCREADSAGALPSECKPESAQFLAWKFGQIAGRFAVPDNRWHDDPFGNLSNLSDAPWEGQFQRGQEKTYEALNAVMSLLCEYDPARDSQKMRRQYVSLWRSCWSYRGLPLAEISSATDLYWAMRIGFADKILESAQQGVLVQVRTEPLPIIRGIESIKDIVTTIALRQVKQERDLDRKHDEMLQRLSPNKREIYQHLQQQQLGMVWGELPAKVVNTLVKAEKYRRSEVNDDDAKVWFHKAVEASLNCCIMEPLVSFMQKRGDKQIAVCFPPPRGVERKSSTALSKLSPWEWADVLETLAAPSHKDLASLGTNDLKEFMKAHLGGSRLPDLRSLARSLRMVQQYRKESAHYQKAESRYDKEKRELEQMRNLVLGINEPSVITEIFQLLSAEK